MKKLTLFSVLGIGIAVTSLQSCSKIAQVLQYNIPLQTGSITIVIPPASAATGSASGTGTNSINIDSVIKANTANTLGVSNITSVKLTSATMMLANNANTNSANNFQNFSSCYVSFATNANSNPFQISISNNPDTYATSLVLPVDSTQNLASYLSGNQFTYSAGGQLRTATTDSLTCTIMFTFDIHVQG